MKKTTTRNYYMKPGILASALCLLAGGLILFSPSAARAASGTLLDASGDWSNGAGLWVGGIICDGAGSSLSGNNVANNTTRTITLDSSRTIGSIYCNQNGATRIRVFAPLMGTETLTLTAGSITALNGPMVFQIPVLESGGMYFRPWGVGAVVLSATNSWPGDTTISQGNSFGQGSVRVGSLGAIPHGAGAGNVIIDDSGDAYGTLNLLSNSITINGLSGTGGKVTTSDTTAGTSILTVGDNNANGTFAGTIDDGSARAVGLTKIGSGVQILNSVVGSISAIYHTYSGDTAVDAGTLQIDGSIGGGATASAVKVAEAGNGGTLCGNGEIIGPVTVYATGKISAGASGAAGKLTLFGGLDMSAPNTTCTWHLGANSESNPGVDFDQIVQSAGSADVDSANLNIQFTGSATAPDGTGFWANDHTWTIITGTVNNNFLNIQNGTNAFGFFYTSGGTLNFKANTTPVPQKPKITSITGAGTASVTVNYNNCVVGKTYILEYKTIITGGWTQILPGKLAATASDSQTDATASGSQRYYRVGYAP